MSEKTDCAANGGYHQWLSSLYTGLEYGAHDSAGLVRHVDIALSYLSFWIIVNFTDKTRQHKQILIDSREHVQSTRAFTIHPTYKTLPIVPIVTRFIQFQQVCLQEAFSSESDPREVQGLHIGIAQIFLKLAGLSLIHKK